MLQEMKALHLPCWDDKELSKEPCCGRGAGTGSPYDTGHSADSSCFNMFFTARECCASGQAILFPEGSASAARFADGTNALQQQHDGGRRPHMRRENRHPSESYMQRNW